MTKKAAAKNGRYFIAIPTSMGGPEHMTIKFLGELSSNQVDKVKRSMDDLNAIQKMPIVSEGIGLLGRKNMFMVNFVNDEDKRLQDVFSVFNKSSRNLVPHVTSFKVKKGPPTKGYNSGALPPMQTLLADKVVLYKTVGAYKYIPIKEVKLQRRTPWNWIKDRFANWV